MNARNAENEGILTESEVQAQEQAKEELQSRPSRMERLFINNMFLKTQRKEKQPLKIV
jgi:hypothetical protein